MHRIMQYKRPDDFVIATGIQYSVREFLIKCFRYFGVELNFTKRHKRKSKNFKN